MLRSPCPRSVTGHGAKNTPRGSLSVSANAAKSQQAWQREGWSCFLSPPTSLPSQCPHNRSTFTMSTGGNAPVLLHGQNSRAQDWSIHTEKSHLPPVLYLLHKLWLSHSPMVSITFNKIIPPGGLVDATNHRSSHAFTPYCVCGSSSVSAGRLRGLDSSNQHTHVQMHFCPVAWAEQLEFQVQHNLMLEGCNISSNCKEQGACWCQLVKKPRIS